MDLLILDKSFKSVGIIDQFESLLWNDRYNDYGDFEIYLPMSTDIMNMAKQDYYLWKKDSEHVMIIEGIEIKSDIVEDGDHLIITGRSLESLLERRIIWNQTVLSGNLQNGIKTLINENIIAPTISERTISNFIFEDSEDTAITELEIDAQYTGDNLFEVIKSVCQEHELGFKITLNDDNQFVFTLYNGIDRSYKQIENPYIIFSPKFDNLISSDYSETSLNWKNVALIGGEGEGSERKTATVGEDSGLDRREMFVDARDISSKTEDETELTPEEYTAQLVQRGEEQLSADENKYTQKFEAEVEPQKMFVYGTDYFIGDIVQITNSYGMDNRARITEFITSISDSGIQTYPKFEIMEEQIVDYNNVDDKPKINGITLDGELTIEDLGKETITSNEIKEIVDEAYDDAFGG